MSNLQQSIQGLYQITQKLNTKIESFADYIASNYALKSNQLTINSTTLNTNTISLTYNDDYDIQKIVLNNSQPVLIINSVSNFTYEGKIPTFQMWITPTVDITTLIIENAITVIETNNFPLELDANKTYVFVWRLMENTQQLNFAYSF